jgi:hypothetical protein
MGAPNKPVAGQRIERASWVADAVRLSIKGWSLRRIATHVDRDHTTVAEALAKEFERVRPKGEELETLRNIQREQIQRQLSSWIPRSIRGCKDAGLVVFRFLERAAKLDGLDAPAKKEVTGADGAPLLDLSGLSDEQIDRIIARSGDAGSADRSSEAGESETEP